MAGIIAVTYPYGYFHPEWFKPEPAQMGLAKIGEGPEITATPRVVAGQPTSTPVTPSTQVVTRPAEGARMVRPVLLVTG